MSISKHHKNYLSAQISCLKAGRSCNSLPSDWLTQNDFANYKLMETVLQHYDPAFRADGFYLLCNDPRGTVDLTVEEITLIKSCLYLSMDIQNASSRYIITCGLKKIFSRLIRVVYGQFRDVNKRKSYLKLLSEGKEQTNAKEVSDTKDQVEYYQKALERKADFLRWLYDFIVSFT